MKGNNDNGQGSDEMMIGRVTAVLEESGIDPSPSATLATLHLANAGATTSKRTAEKMLCSRNSARTAMVMLYERGLAERTARASNNGAGDYATVYEPAGDLERARQNTLPPSATDDKREVIIESLARIHWGVGVSTARIKQVAEGTGYTTRQLSPILRQLVEEGIIEDADEESMTCRWRLVGASAYTPFRAGAGE